MCAEHVERRLTAILAADVVGYSRLLEADEEDTLHALRLLRRELFDPTVANHSGHIIKVMGDGFLVEFASVLSAARCAVEIQRGMLERNRGIPPDKQIEFRIGLNLGDVVFETDDFHGDGINVAVRLQALATPGGIACSSPVRHEIGNKLGLDFADQGHRTVKNISRPVHVYFADWGKQTSGAVLSRAASGHTRAAVNKPSVAILPFANISNDSDQEFFSDGITEDIITDLSNVSGLFVLSRNTVFTWKGRNENLQRIARELGVEYVVEGSVRRAGNHVRINAELIEAASDGHLWAARYDRDITDIFQVQDEIAKAIVDQLRVKLLPEEKRAIELAPTGSVEAYTHYLRGREYYHMASRSSHLMARQSFARAIELDPGYARAYAGVAVCDARLRSQFGMEIRVDDILANTAKALAIDDRLAEAHAARGVALAVVGNRTDAETAFEQALLLGPNCHEANRYYAEFCVTEGRFEPAATYFQRALEIKPADYAAPMMLVNVFRSLGQIERAKSYAQIAVQKAEEEMRLHPENANVACLGATALAFLGVRDRALEWLARSLATDPNDINIQYNAACTYALLGEIDTAIDLLETWIPQVGVEMRLWFENDSDLDSVRAHPRYSKLLGLSE